MKNNSITVIYKGYKIDIDYLKQQIGNYIYTLINHYPEIDFAVIYYNYTTNLFAVETISKDEEKLYRINMPDNVVVLYQFMQKNFESLNSESLLKKIATVSNSVIYDFYKILYRGIL